MGEKLLEGVRALFAYLEIGALLDGHMAELGMVIGLLLWLCIFAGFYVYRALFSGLVFLGTALLCCLLGKGRYSWGDVTAVFCVVGVILAFLAFRACRLGAVCICALLPFLWLWSWQAHWLLAALAAIAGGLFAFWFPVAALESVTAIFGSLLLFLPSADCLLGGSEAALALPAAGVAFLGLLSQAVVNRRQSLFAKTCPDTVRYYLENRRRGNDRVSKRV